MHRKMNCIWNLFIIDQKSSFFFIFISLPMNQSFWLTITFCLHFDKLLRLQSTIVEWTNQYHYLTKYKILLLSKSVLKPCWKHIYFQLKHSLSKAFTRNRKPSGSVSEVEDGDRRKSWPRDRFSRFVKILKRLSDF